MYRCAMAMLDLPEDSGLRGEMMDVDVAVLVEYRSA